MGRLFDKNSQHTVDDSKRKVLTKGERLGWMHKSDYEFKSMRNIDSPAVQMITYTTGPFSDNKLIP